MCFVDLDTVCGCALFQLHGVLCLGMLQQWLILGVTVPKMLEAAREMHRAEGVAEGEPLTPKQVGR